MSWLLVYSGSSSPPVSERRWDDDLLPGKDLPRCSRMVSAWAGNVLVVGPGCRLFAFLLLPLPNMEGRRLFKMRDMAAGLLMGYGEAR